MTAEQDRAADVSLLNLLYHYALDGCGDDGTAETEAAYSWLRAAFDAPTPLAELVERDIATGLSPTPMFRLQTKVPATSCAFPDGDSECDPALCPTGCFQ